MLQMSIVVFPLVGRGGEKKEEEQLVSLQIGSLEAWVMRLAGVKSRRHVCRQQH
jgi:hypothetical protein